MCWCRKIGWFETEGKGVLYSHAAVHAAPAYFQADLPFQVCVVDLEDGPRVATRLMGDVTGPMFNKTTKLVTVLYDDGALFAATPDVIGS